MLCICFSLISDTRKAFLDEAQKLGIDKTFLIDPKSPSQNTAIKIWEHIGDYPRLIFDCRGSQLSNQVAVDVSCLFETVFVNLLITSF